MRRADSTEAIGIAPVAKAGGAGYRTIAARYGRPESTVRRWLRAVREPHAQWLYRRGVDQAVLIDRELLVRPAPQRTTLGHALNLLAGAAFRFQDRDPNELSLTGGELIHLRRHVPKSPRAKGGSSDAN